MRNKQAHIIQDLYFRTRRINEVDIAEGKIPSNFLWPFPFVGININSRDPIDGLVNLGARAQCECESLQIRGNLSNRERSNQHCEENTTL